MLATIGETGIRIEEALSLEWMHIDFRRQMLIVELTKDNEPREIPLSDYAVGWLQGVVRYVHCPYVFVSPKTQIRWVNPYNALRRACKKVGIQIAFHDLRRFRCTQWLTDGVDVRTVQGLMGHSDIQTTMRYVGYVSKHAIKSIREAQRSEEIESAQEAGEITFFVSGAKLLKRMARPEGFEPPTYGFEVRRSIQLSYGRALILKDLRIRVLAQIGQLCPELKPSVSASSGDRVTGSPSSNFQHFRESSTGIPL